jgi:protein-tyrosine phosphatase
MSISGRSIDEGRPARALRIDGVLNARDIGGVSGELGPVRTGLVLRSACLSELTSDGARTLAGLGLRTVIDLRTPLERQEEPNRLAAAAGLEGVRELRVELLATLNDLPSNSVGMYQHLVERCGCGIVAVLEELARPGALPALVHCLVGKDRTGLTVALLLDLLGVDRTKIVADYIESNLGLGSKAHTLVQAEVMEATLADLDKRYGSPQGYLVEHGLADETVKALRAALLGWSVDADADADVAGIDR